jgi:hypothetical protein
MRIWTMNGAAFLALSVFAAPLFADVVPARKTKADRDAVAVERRLVTLGMDASAARGSADRLTPSELWFFATDTSKLHPVGQQDMFAGQTVNLWFESIGGAVMLAAGLGTGYYMLHNRE